MSDLLSQLALVEAALLLVLGVRVVYARPAARLNLLFGLLALVQVGWLVGFALMVSADDAPTAWLWYRVGAVGWTFGPVVVWHFIAALTRKPWLERRSWLLLVAYAPAAVLFGRQLTSSALALELVPTAFGWSERIVPGNPWAYVVLGHLVGFSFTAFWWTYRWGRALAERARWRQARLMLLSGLTAFALALGTNILPGFAGLHEIPGLGPLLMPLWMFALWGAIGGSQLRSLSPALAAERVLRAMADAVLLLSPRDVVLQANRAAERLFGVAAGGLVGRRLTDFLPGQPDTAMRQRVSGGTMFRSEVSFAPDGEPERTLSVTAALVTDEPGEILGTAMILRDISERKRWERRLQDREEHFRRLIESVADMIFIVDVDGTIRYASPSFRRWLGAPSEPAPAISDRSILDRLHEEDRSTFRERTLEPASRGEQPNRVEIRCRGSDGSWRVLEVVSAPLREADEPCVLVSARDVTDRKDMEARLAQAERTALDARLVHANRLASAGLLAASVSHEITNPLTLVIGNLELAADRVRRLARRGDTQDSAAMATGPIDAAPFAGRATGAAAARQTRLLLEDVSHWIRDAIDGGWRIERIVSDLRSFARGDRAPDALVDLNRVVERTVSLAATHLQQRAELTLELGRALPAGRAAEGLVGQVLLNLLLNALHATSLEEKPRNRIVIRTAADEANVRLEVEDAGQGIAEEDLGRIFEPFYTTKPAEQGSGLGLWVARHVVQAWGGRIEVRSRMGEGSTFTVWIPRADRASEASTDAADELDGLAGDRLAESAELREASAMAPVAARPTSPLPPRSSGYDLESRRVDLPAATRPDGSSSDAA